MMDRRLLFVTVLCFVSKCLGQSLPKYIKVCMRDPATIDDCLLDMVESLRPHLPSGIPQMAIPPTDPFRLTELKLYRTGGTVEIKGILSNVTVKGGRRFKIESLRVDLRKLTLEADLSLPEAQLKFDYHVRGSVLGVGFNSIGKYEGSTRNLKLSVKMMAHLENGNDKKEYVVVDKVESSARWGPASQNKNRKDQDSLISPELRAINEKHFSVIEEAKTPIVNDIMNEIIRITASQVTCKVSYTDFVPRYINI